MAEIDTMLDDTHTVVAPAAFVVIPKNVVFVGSGFTLRENGTKKVG